MGELSPKKRQTKEGVILTPWTDSVCMAIFVSKDT